MNKFKFLISNFKFQIYCRVWTKIRLTHFIIFIFTITSWIFSKHTVTSNPIANIETASKIIEKLKHEGFHPELQSKSWKGKNFFFLVLGNYPTYSIASEVIKNLPRVDILFEVVSNDEKEAEFSPATGDDFEYILENTSNSQIPEILKLNPRQIQYKEVQKLKPETQEPMTQETQEIVTNNNDLIRKKITETAWNLRKEGYKVGSSRQNKDKNLILTGIYNSIKSAEEMQIEMEEYGYKTKIEKEGSKEPIYYVYVIRGEGEREEKEKKDKEKDKGIIKLPARGLK